MYELKLTNPDNKESFVIVDKKDFHDVKDVTWQLRKNKYGNIAYNSNMAVSLHYFIMDYDKENERVKFINGNKLDCRRNNMFIIPLGEKVYKPFEEPVGFVERAPIRWSVYQLVSREQYHIDLFINYDRSKKYEIQYHVDKNIILPGKDINKFCKTKEFDNISEAFNNIKPIYIKNMYRIYKCIDSSGIIKDHVTKWLVMIGSNRFYLTYYLNSNVFYKNDNYNMVKQYSKGIIKTIRAAAGYVQPAVKGRRMKRNNNAKQNKVQMW